MSQDIAICRGTSANEDALIKPVGTLRADTDLNNLRLHDGVTPGGNVIPNETQIGLLVVRSFMGTVTDSTPGDLVTATVIGNLVFLNAAGDFKFPPLSEFDIGQGFRTQATTTAVTVSFNGAEQGEDHGADSAGYALTEDEIVTWAKKSPTRWIVIDRY